MILQQGTPTSKKRKEKRERRFRYGEQIGVDHTEDAESLEFTEGTEEPVLDTEDSYDPWQKDLEAELEEI